MNSTVIERKVVMALLNLIVDESKILDRWRKAGKALGILGGLLVTMSLIAALQQTVVERSLVFVSVLGGLFIGLSAWFSSFTMQWPIIAPYISREALEKRANELRV